MRPTLVYDDDCGFCTRAARFVARHGSVELVGFSELSPSLRDRLPPDYRTCSHLLTEEGVYSCGESIERALAETELLPAALFSVFRTVPGYPALREWGYRRLANNRGTIGRVLP
ncbi:MAG: thiol-disulfide oxidoreductase DCC family protein [Haloferacaceae archaeon]